MNLPPLIERPPAAWIASGVSGLLVVAAFPDVEFDIVLWVALVPLLAAARGAGRWRGFRLGMCCGVAVELAGFYWVAYAIGEFGGMPIVVAALLFILPVLYHALAWGALGWLLGGCRTPREVFLATAIWVGIEHVFPRLFPWHLGDALFAREWLRQAADIFGGSGLTHVVVLCNVAIYLLLEWRRGRIAFPRASCATAVGLVIAMNVYGAIRYDGLRRGTEHVRPIRAGVIQPNVDPREKPSVEAFKALVAKSIALVRRDAPDLVLWPEGAAPPGIDQARNLDLQRLIGVPLVVGAQTRVGDRVANSALYIRSGAIDVYHKSKLVLFGEWLPFESILPRWLLDLIPIRTLYRGTENPIMRLGAHTFRNLMCYEAILSGYVRTVTSSDEALDFLVNLTEDGWYGKTSQAGQHRAVLVMRVVESRVPLLRCTNVGPSGGVTVAGDFVDATPIFAAAERVVSIRPGRARSLYRAMGFVYPYLAFVLGVGASIASYRRRSYTPGDEQLENGG